MIKNGRKVARDYMSYGLNPLPIALGEKRPLNENHNTVKISEEDLDNYPFNAIGISTGLISGSIEAIDFDLKTNSVSILFCSETIFSPSSSNT